MVASAPAIDPLEAAREAVARQDWREAHAAFTGTDVDDLGADDLASFAEATWWSGKLDDAIKLRERTVRKYVAEGDKVAAARLAVALSWDHIGRGAIAVSRGWFAKAERLLEGQPEAVVHGHVFLTRAWTMMYEGKLAESLGQFDEAHALGTRFGDSDIEAMALVGKGRALVHLGRVEEGLALLDEASATAVGGALRPFATGFVYCCTINSCQTVGDYRRAAEWTEAANRWCDGIDMSGFPGACRIHRAEILRLRGDWPQAEAQALAACEELRDFDRYISASGYYEIGEIQRRRGDFAAAEESYRKAHEYGRDPEPGLARLRLAEGKTDAAAAQITRAVGEAEEPLVRVALLPAQVEIALARRDLKTARTAAADLEEIVDMYKIGARRAPAFDAEVTLASGRINLAEGDWKGAVACTRRARDMWQEVGAPYEIAQARTLLAIAYRRDDDEHAAGAELAAALETFVHLGARLDEERVKELLGLVQEGQTFVFTDIVESTKLLESLGVEKWRRLLARHDQLLRERIAESGGEVIKHTGDGFFASFKSSKAAVEASVAIQRALAEEIVAPDVRIGIHAGAAFSTGDDVTDYGGQGVHAAARIGAAAGAGEILVSRDTFDGDGTVFRLSEPRPETLKGFDQPVELVAVDWR